VPAQYETPPPVGDWVVGAVWAGAGLAPPAGLLFVDDEPHAVKPAATATPRAAPKISLRAPNP
jgi:hypothetical protein